MITLLFGVVLKLGKPTAKIYSDIKMQNTSYQVKMSGIKQLIIKVVVLTLVIGHIQQDPILLLRLYPSPPEVQLEPFTDLNQALLM